MDTLLTVKEVADRLRVDEETVRRYLRDGVLKGKKMRHEWRVTQDELDRYIRGEHGEESEGK